MHPEKLVGSVGVRLIALVALLLCLAAVGLDGRGVFPALDRVWPGLAIGSGILAFLAFIHAFQAVYARWMRLAKVINTAVVTGLFGACYLLVVPFFFLMVWAFDPLRVRKQPREDTFWIRRRSNGMDLSAMQRMG